jgi:hypothetical protein
MMLAELRFFLAQVNVGRQKGKHSPKLKYEFQL